MSGSTRATDRLRDVADRRPGAFALIGQRPLSYAELVAEVDATVRGWRATGVADGDTVAVLSERTPALPIALLSAWAIGATVALIDAAMPPARIAECLDVVRPDWRVTLDSSPPVRRRDSARLRPSSHILFTSGTTGRPAAIDVSHTALEQTLNWYLDAFGPTPEDRVALLSGPGHDPVLRDVLIPLLAGGALVVPPADVFASPARLWSFVRDAGITILHGTPALMEVLLAGRPAGALAPGRLRLIVSGGATLTAGLARQIRAGTRATIVNAYGATETPQIASCAVVSSARLDDPALPAQAALEVGAGVAGAELLIVGDDDEIVVRSPNLAEGYVGGTGVPDRFIKDPLGQPNFRAYRTGDRGRREPSGGVTIVGRLDRQLSVNGFRVAAEEVEAIALGHPAVRRAQAAVHSGPAGDLLGLSVVLAADCALDAREMRRYLRERLPTYAVPTNIRFVPASALRTDHKAASARWS